VQLKWNQLGTTLIVLAQTEVDKTGKSYYGETTLYVLSANGGFDSRITLDKEGPIHDVSWSPNSKEFGVIYGYMPAKTTIFNQRAVATYTFPMGPRNTILFSPTGRFVLVAGFGNLAGQMDIYDLEKDYKKICTIEGGNPSVCEWSPDSRYILTATTSPRLRVDNGVRLWHVGGGIMYNEDMVELYHVTYRPQAIESVAPGDPLNPVPTPHASALAYLGTVKTPSKPAGAYRPPGARGTSTPLHFKREDEGGAAHIVAGGTSLGGSSNGFGARSRRLVPGAETVESGPPGSTLANGPVPGADGDAELSKAALKNKKKRESKKAKEAEAKAAGLTTAPEGPLAGGTDNRSPDRRDRREHQRSRSKGQNSQDARNPSQHRERRQTNPGRQNGQNGPPGFNGVNNQQNNHGRQNGQNGPPGFNGQNNQGRQNGPPGFNGVPNNQGRQNGPPGFSTPPAGNMKNLSISSVRAEDIPDLSITSPTGGSPAAKKVRGLQKKIRAIEDLEMRLAGGEKLEDTQMKKIATKQSVQVELTGLEAEL